MKLSEVNLTKEEMKILKGPFIFAEPSSDAKITLDRVNEVLSAMDTLIPIGEKINKALLKESSDTVKKPSIITNPNHHTHPKDLAINDPQSL